MDLFPVSHNPRWRLAAILSKMAAGRHLIQDGGWPPSWKILNGHIPGMSYPIHFHELQINVGGIQEKMHEE